MYLHASIKELNGEELYFTPRIPPQDNRMELEDDSIPRICVSETVEGCLDAIRSCIGELLIEEAKTGVSSIVYIYAPEEEIDENYIISNECICKRNLVPDAIHTGETWITKPVKMKLHKIIELWGMSDRWVNENDEYDETQIEDEGDMFYLVDDYYVLKKIEWNYTDFRQNKRAKLT